MNRPQATKSNDSWKFNFIAKLGQARILQFFFMELA
jgi:hypothetical protein